MSDDKHKPRVKNKCDRFGFVLTAPRSKIVRVCFNFEVSKYFIKLSFKFSVCSEICYFATEDYWSAALNRATVVEFSVAFYEKVSCRLSHAVRQN